METIDSENLTQNAGKHWMVESATSRTALLAIIYLCVNVVYEQGYLSRLGFEYGFFSITRTLPIFDNFILVIYAFALWAGIIELSNSTFNQIFGLFNHVSLRDARVTAYRILAFFVVLAFYFSLQVFYFAVSNIDTMSLITNRNEIWTDIQNNPVPSVSQVLIWPTWGFLTWWGNIFFVLLALFSLYLLNRKYRKTRNLRMLQAEPNKLKHMFIHINIISPISLLLSIFLCGIMLPAFYGGAMAQVTLNKLSEGQAQQIQQIELKNVNMFCGEKINKRENAWVWFSRDNTFSIHYLGKLDSFQLFARVNHGVDEEDELKYNLCLLSSSNVAELTLFGDE